MNIVEYMMVDMLVDIVEHIEWLVEAKTIPSKLGNNHELTAHELPQPLLDF